MADLLVQPRPAKSLQNGSGILRRLQRKKKLEKTGPVEKKRGASMPQSEQLASTPEPPLPKGKGSHPSVQITRS